MCGICGIINFDGKPVDKELIEVMCSTMVHRGPDDAGAYVDGYVSLGHKRLSVIDLSKAGHQPMSNEDRTVWITYNGELYNFQTLRSLLIAHGHKFKSKTDTEVIIHAYEEWGIDCLDKFNGMFAFAIWDDRNKLFLLARDHFGVKPLYYIYEGKFFAFASEIKALLLLPAVPREVDIEALHQYLTFLWVPDPKTMFRKIFKLLAGHYLILKMGNGKWGMGIKRYWDLKFPPMDHHYNQSVPELIDKIRELFCKSVKSQMISDVPIGAFLSAGLDSGSIVSMMSQNSKESVRTYTITFPSRYRIGEITLDDANIANLVAKKMNCHHTEIVVEPDVVKLLPKIIWHLDEPIADPAAITAYLICREARSTTTVLLSGVGGDELFAGYRKYIGHYLAQQYCHLPVFMRQRVIEPLIMALPPLRGTSLRGYIRLAKKMARSGSLPPRERFITNCTYLMDNQKATLYSDELREATREFNAWEVHQSYFDRVKDANFLNQMLYLDTKTFMVSLNLTYTDKMSMASSVEVRVPFLDRELAEFLAWEVPPYLKIKGFTTKYILRKAMDGILPSQVLKAPKAGFGAPVGYWLTYDLRPMVEDLLSESAVCQRGYFNPKIVRHMVVQHMSGQYDWAMQIWQLLTLEIWLQIFIDK